MDPPTSSRVVWQQFIDQNTGNAYYFNITTGESQWEEPDAPFNPHQMFITDLDAEQRPVDVMLCIIRAQALIRYAF